MKSSTQSQSIKSVNGLPPGRSALVPHFEALRQTLDLPPTAMVGDALHFLIGPDMNVVVLLSDNGQLLLLVELADMDSLLAQDWQRLALHLSSHFDDSSMGRLIVLDRKLSMAWSHASEMDPESWVQCAKEAMLWCTGARELLTGQAGFVQQ
jgi:hypothetical protein